MPLIVPLFAESQTATVTIDGVTYRVPLLDADSRFYVTPRAVGASEVKAILFTSASDSSARATVITPTSGKKVRIIGCRQTSASAAATGFQVYFGTGAAITTTPAKAIDYAVLDLTDSPVSTIVWPDGGGPVGDVDEVVSFKTNADIVAGARIVITYREE